MKFQPGQSGNPKGKRPGTPNRVTKEARELVLSIVRRELPRLKKDLKGLEGTEHAAIVIKLLNYVLPRLSSNTLEFDSSEQNDNAIDARIRELLKTGGFLEGKS